MADISQQTVHDIQLWCSGAFGTVIGWYIYYINRHRRDDVSATDLVTLIGIIGGTAVLALFPAQSDLFGAYGLGLAIGFFGYFLVMVLLVAISSNFVCPSTVRTLITTTLAPAIGSSTLLWTIPLAIEERRPRVSSAAR